MILAPDVARGMRLEASLDEIQQIGYALYCLWNRLVHVVEGVQMPTEVGAK